MQGSEIASPVSFFSHEQHMALSKGRCPTHIAIIPDGNRRWAKQYWLAPLEGHRRGAQILIQTIQAAKELGIKMVTVYGFSTENMQRPKREVDMVLWLIEKNLRECCADMVASGIHFQPLGDPVKLPESLKRTILHVQTQTSSCRDITLALAINYSGRDELCRAVQRLTSDCQEGKLSPSEVDETLLSSYLDTDRHPDPDLLIRPGGERRLSNFLLWQLSYAELYFCDKLWPDFTPQDLYEAVAYFQERERRLGL